MLVLMHIKGSASYACVASEDQAYHYIEISLEIACFEIFAQQEEIVSFFKQ